MAEVPVFLMDKKKTLEDFIVPFLKEVQITEEKTGKLPGEELRKYADANAPRGHIVPKDSPAGYFQLLAFDLIGNRFALWWHSHYGELHILCSDEYKHKIIEKYIKQEDIQPTEEQLQAIDKVDVTPILHDFQRRLHGLPGSGQYRRRTQQGEFRSLYANKCT